MAHLVAADGEDQHNFPSNDEPKGQCKIRLMPDINCLLLANVNIKSSRDDSNANYQLALYGKYSGRNPECPGDDIN